MGVASKLNSSIISLFILLTTPIFLLAQTPVTLTEIVAPEPNTYVGGPDLGLTVTEDDDYLYIDYVLEKYYEHTCVVNQHLADLKLTYDNVDIYLAKMYLSNEPDPSLTNYTHSYVPSSFPGRSTLYNQYTLNELTDSILVTSQYHVWSSNYGKHSITTIRILKESMGLVNGSHLNGTLILEANYWRNFTSGGCNSHYMAHAGTYSMDFDLYKDQVLPDMTIDAVTPSPSSCEIEVSWIEPAVYSLSEREYVGVYRNGTIVDTIVAHFGPNKYIDTDIQAGTDYDYQIEAIYMPYDAIAQRGTMSAAVTDGIPYLDAPFNVTLTQNSCVSDITIDWGWSGADPQNFVLERSSTTSGFSVISGTIPGGARTFVDNNGISTDELYSYRLAAVDSRCGALGNYSDIITLSRDTIDIALTIQTDGLETSKGYFDDRTELFWNTTGINDQYLERFKIYGRVLGSTATPALLQTVNESVRSWFHQTGDAGTVYEYFIVGERVVNTPCGNQITPSFEINSLAGIQTDGNLPSDSNGVAYAVGFRYPTAIVNGNITYAGGIAVPDVKVVAEKYSGNNGNSLYLAGNDHVNVPAATALSFDTALTISSWVNMDNLSLNQVILEKDSCYGIGTNANGTGYFYIHNAADGIRQEVTIPDSLLNNGDWTNITATYSATTNQLVVYVNGITAVDSTLSAGVTGILQRPANDIFIGKSASGVTNYYQGYIDETKLYNRALPYEEARRTYGAVSATDAQGLVAYWKVFVGVGDYIYDAAHTGSSYYRHDGKINGAIWSTEIPSPVQLGFAAYTDQNGNYSITGIGYSGAGVNYNIIPSATLAGAIHEFDPVTRTLFVGVGNTIHNNIDFQDISSFPFSGYAKFLFDDVEGVNFQSSGSEGVKIYLDGQSPLTNSNNAPYETDAQGYFNVDVPIGHHFLEFRKDGHTFTYGGRFPISGTWDFQDEVSGVEIWDSTTHILTGKVVGGTTEANKPVGMNRTINNIGRAKFTLTSLDGKIIRDVVTDSLTGEYEIQLPPKRYNYSDVEWVINNVDIEPSGNIATIDLADVLIYHGTYETDSVFLNDTTLSHVDSSFYHLRRDFIYRITPELVVDKTPDEFYSSVSADSLVNISLITLPFDTYTSRKSYTMTMQAVEIYTNLDNNQKDTSIVTDGQITINNNIGDGYWLDGDGKQNLYSTPTVLSLNNGSVDYSFVASFPNTTEVTSSGLEHLSFTKQMNVSLEVGDFVTPWPNPADPTENYIAYVLGGKPNGTNFVTKSPEIVDFVLRDPPGSNSYAFLDQSTTQKYTNEWTMGGEIGLQQRAELGMAANTSVGFFGCANEEVNVAAYGYAQVDISFRASGGEEYISETTLNSAFQTNDAPIQIGESDLYVAKSENLETGVAVHVVPIALADCGGFCHGDTMYDDNGAAYRMTRIEKTYVGPFGGPTYVAYSEAHITDVLIPELESIRNTYLTSSSSYTSNLPPNDPMYGTNNDDPLWGGSVSSIDPIATDTADYVGQSYTFNWNNDPLLVDSVRWVNQQIRLWKEALADNEIAKWKAIRYTNPMDKENISLASGITLSQSKTQNNSVTKHVDFELATALTVGGHVGSSGGGLHVLADNSVKVSLDASYTHSWENTEVTTTGYTLLDSDPNDALSIDIYPGVGTNGAIFSIAGGQTSCPHEGEVLMQYTTVEYLNRIKARILEKRAVVQKQIDAQIKIEQHPNTSDEGRVVAAITRAILEAKLNDMETPAHIDQLISEIQAGDVALSNPTLQRDKPSLLINGATTAQAFNVPANQSANFTLLLQNESETQDDQWYGIQVLDGTNPHGLEIRIDGQVVGQQTQFFVPGGGAIQKVMQVSRGPFEYSYTDVQIIIHSVCEMETIRDTVTFNVDYLPTCTEVEIIAPDDSWTLNNSFNNQLPITVGGYDVNSADFEQVKVQYKPSSSSSWTLLESYFRDTTITGWAGEPTLPQSGNTFTYFWDLGLLPDGDYDIRAVATCALAETNSIIHSGVVDRLNPLPFGAPQPSDGVLTPGEEISIQFNEPINAGLLSASNIDLRGVLNAGNIRHDASIYFDGATNDVTIPQVNVLDHSFTIEWYAKRSIDGIQQVMISQGANSANELSLGFDASNRLFFNYGGSSITTVNSTDNNWHHYAVSFDEDQFTAVVYIDGVEENIDVSFYPDFDENSTLSIGASVSGSGANFQGNIHELRLWTITLTESEINQVAVKRMIGNEAGLFYNWEMEEANGTVVHDKVREKHGQLNATWVVEPVGYGLRLNGEIDQAELTPIAISSESDYTVEFWFKSDGTPDEVILSNGTGDFNDANTSGWSMGVDASGYFYAQSNDEVLSSSFSVLDGNWHHAALVTKAQGNAVLYVDALEEDFITNDSLNGFSGPGLWIGQQGWYDLGMVEQNAKQYNGNIDELRIWNTARKLDQIDRDRFNKLSGNEPGLIEYYPFEAYTTNQGITTVSSNLDNASTSNLAINTSMTITGTANLDQITPTIKLERPIQSLNFTYVVNNDQIIITPNVDEWRIENTQLDITVSNIQDLNENTLVSPVTWIAYIDKNQVVWQDQSFDLETEVGTDLTFNTNVLNNSGQSALYTISNIPSWLQVSPSSGSVGPINSVPISFTVPSNVNIGEYEQDILLTTDFGYAERLEIKVKVKEQPPADWTVDPTQYQYSMNIIGQLSINSIVSRNEEDMLAVFVNGDCRGVATLQYLSAYDNYQAFLSIYSNQPSGEELEFMIWEAATGSIHPVVTHNLPSTQFMTNAFYGSGAAPEMFDANNYIAGTIDVPQGWKWVSFNLLGTDLDTINHLLEDLNSQDNDLIKTRLNLPDGQGGFVQETQFDTYTSGLGWVGSISQYGGAEIGALYKIQTSNMGTIEYEGELRTPDQDTIHLIAGWNYLGYVGNVNVSLTEGLSNYTPTTGDIIKSQYQSSIYDASFGWIGSLTTLEPNVGYMIQTAVPQSFTYPMSCVVKSANNPSMLDQLVAQSPWEVNFFHSASNMTVIAQVINDDENYNTYHSNEGVVGAFVGEECRGVALPIYDSENDSYLYFITINGEVVEDITFKYYNTKDEVEYKAFESLKFEMDEITGGVGTPFPLNLEKGLVTTNGDQAVDIYPNPFSQTTMINLELNSDEEVIVYLEDLRGRVVKMMNYGIQNEGSITVEFDANRVPDGIYFVRINAGDQSYKKKVVIAK